MLFLKFYLCWVLAEAEIRRYKPHARSDQHEGFALSGKTCGAIPNDAGQEYEQQTSDGDDAKERNHAVAGVRPAEKSRYSPPHSSQAGSVRKLRKMSKVWASA